MNSAPEKPKVIVVCGPTGIGKTTVGIELAQRFNGEIVSADSMQIYRYMNIGTAKPTAEELDKIAHHMIDIVDPDEDYDAVLFSKQARDQVTEITSRGLVPFIVGGTGLYIKAILHGLFQAKAIDSEVRKRLKREAEENSSGFLFERLKRVDPAAADRIHPNDSYRIIRALETLESSGKTISDHHQNHKFRDDPFNPLKIGLQMNRHTLYERIDKRVDLMLKTGLVDEVKTLLALGYKADLKPMQSIGYRHIVRFLEASLPWDECLQTFKRDTRRYAKRQLTWFGADRNVIWQTSTDVDGIMTLVNNFLNHPEGNI
jgi:tRNA dimethylallyltransferase